LRVLFAVGGAEHVVAVGVMLAEVVPREHSSQRQVVKARRVRRPHERMLGSGGAVEPDNNRVHGLRIAATGPSVKGLAS
jgi:hypothetical protein